jgi:metallophosphoesterase (TIGR03767 family)
VTGPRINRRRFVAGASTTAAAVAWAPGWWTPARARDLHATLATAIAPAGTTLESTIEIVPGDGYRPLRAGPGWPTVVRADLAAPRDDRADRRTALASIVHLTDTHLIDAQSPGRVEFLDRYGAPYTAAWRPQEALSVHVMSSMVERINAVGRGPITGRPFDCAVSTGDNIDNCQHNELDWFIRVLDGGPVAANSGDPATYEGVQDVGDTWAGYWHPGGGADDYLAAGFPTIDGLLDAAIAPFVAPGIGMRWYSTYGNHDGLLQGNLPRVDAIDQLLVAGTKVVDLRPGEEALAFVVRMLSDAPALVSEILGGGYPTRSVTPDAARRTLTTTEWVSKHLASGGVPGPAGHGYTDDHLELPALWYSFEIAPGVLGLSLDTGGYNSGSIGQAQLDFLEAELRAVHSRYFDASGAEVRSGATDQLVLLFSHFNPRSMDGFLIDPANPDERRILGDELVAFLHRWPNVVAWVNGHHHQNEVTPYPDASGRTGGFWDINTASHIDWPEHARVVELVDNGDGTLSIFTTMLSHAGPVAADHGDLSPAGLAAISRELSANDPQTGKAIALGDATDLNLELVLTSPFALRDLATQPPPRPASVTPAFTG